MFVVITQTHLWLVDQGCQLLLVRSIASCAAYNPSFVACSLQRKRRNVSARAKQERK